MTRPVILASTSRYRLELMQRLLPDIEAVAPNVDERAFKGLGLSPAELAQRLALEKARAVTRRFPDAIVIGSDQVAELDGRIFDKPGSVTAAIRQLQALSGRTHRLLTAVCICHTGGLTAWIDETRLAMRSLSADEITRYVERDQPLDCAGSYRIECLGISLFKSIMTADFTAIIGLPLLRLSQTLRDLGCRIP